MSEQAMKEACEARLRALIPRQEPVVAVGTAEELKALETDVGSGGGWTFLVVTTSRLLFARWDHSDGPVGEIAFEDAGSWADGHQYNCYVVVVSHPPLIRRERVAAHRFLWLKWGVTHADVARSATILRFSRPGTKAAQALRSALESRGVTHETLRFRERSRAERTRGSHVAATRVEQLEPE